MSVQPTVYQVRCVDVFGNARIIHAYENEDLAKQAISMMKGQTGKRYLYVPVPNDPTQYWGINFPPETETK